MKRLAVLLCTILALLMLSSACADIIPVIDTADDINVHSDSMPVVDDIEYRHVRIRAAGDLMVHDKQLQMAKQADGTYDFHPQYALVSDILANADYTIANLETTIGKADNMAYSGYPLFNTPESLLDTIRDAGIDFLTLANNHMLDRYFDGMCRTVDNVETWGFDHGGAYRTKDEASAPVVVDVNGIRIGFLCYTSGTNAMENHCSNAATAYGVAYLGKADFAADVSRAREAGAEVIIAIPHWGVEYKRYPEASVRSCANKMIAAGVDVILGSHPHMVQPIEYVTVTTDAGERTGLVAWSLGNFIDNMTKQYTDSGIILDFTIYEDEYGVFHFTDVGYVPIYCWHHDNLIQAVSSEMYYADRPAGMSDSAYSRMCASRSELMKLIGSDFSMLKE